MRGASATGTERADSRGPAWWSADGGACCSVEASDMNHVVAFRQCRYPWYSSVVRHGAFTATRYRAAVRGVLT